MKKKTNFFHSEKRDWVVIDAKDKVLGRLSTRVAKILMGKNKATYTPNALCGDRVVVINSRGIKLTGNKENNKIYDKYSGYPSGRKEMSIKKLMEKNPSKVLYIAVKGMVPKNWLGKMMMRGLKIYPDDKHIHQAQNLKKVEV